MDESQCIEIETLQRFVREKIVGRDFAREGAAMPMRIYKELHEQGWFHAFVPKEIGGMGFSTHLLAEFSRELAYGSAGIFSSTIVNVLATLPISLFGSDYLKSVLKSEFLDTFNLWSFCMTEPDAGTDIANLKTSACPASGGFVIHGQKCFITNASYSGHLVVFARVETTNGNRSGITAFYVPASSKGVIRGKALEKLGQHESNTGELFFDDVFVPDEFVIGQVGDGLKIAIRCIQRSKTLIAAAGVGISRRALDLAHQHLSNRVHYGKPLIFIPTLHTKLADLFTRVEAAWLLTLDAATKWDTGDLAVKEASMAKYFSADTAVETVSECLEMFGGYGYMKGFEIEKLYRDVRVLEIFEGATYVQLTLIAREICLELKHHENGAQKAAA